MADSHRFDRLETQNTPLPLPVRQAIEKLTRFQQLEITTTHPRTYTAQEGPSIPKTICLHCHQVNETTRELCWACAKSLQAPAPPKPAANQPIQLLINGVSYLSTDQHLPFDVQELMSRIRAEGNSEAVLAAWEEWRERLPPQSKAGHVELLDGRYVDLLRIDGILYKSDDPQLPPEIREIFNFVDHEGVTPALLQHLKLYGTKVRYRPISSPIPTEGDVSFWNAARRVLGKKGDSS